MGTANRGHLLEPGDDPRHRADQALEIGPQVGSVERDACAIWWYNRARRPAIDLGSGGDPELVAIAEAHTELGREVALLDLRVDTGVPVVGAVAWERESGIALPSGFGCHLDPRVAASRALTELSQVTAVRVAAEGAPPQLATRPQLVPRPSPAVPMDEIPDLTGADTGEDLATCRRLLAAAGLEAFVLETTRAEIGVPAVRVVVPGMRPFRRRFAPGRLYDVPMALGWAAERPTERELDRDRPFS